MKNQIKEVTKVEDFKNVYMVFSGPPYNEKYTDEEIEKIFRQYQENGYIYGAYRGENCIGLVALEKGIQNGHPVNFNDAIVMYLADIAVLNSYRKTGVGSGLMLYAVMQSKQLGYQKLYMRTLEPHSSMSYSIARKIGFTQIPNVYQDIERERTDGKVTSVKNIFLELDLNTLNKNTLRQEIQDLKPKTENLELI